MYHLKFHPSKDDFLTGPSEGGAMGATAPPFWKWKLFLFFLLLACIEVGDVRRYPYPVSGKLTQNFKKEKKVSESIPPPPPPLQFLHNLKHITCVLFTWVTCTQVCVVIAIMSFVLYTFGHDLKSITFSPLNVINVQCNQLSMCASHRPTCTCTIHTSCNL